MATSTQWIVRRETSSGAEAWTGPWHEIALAERERDAWLKSGRRAEVVEFDDDVKARVVRWSKGRERVPFETVAS